MDDNARKLEDLKREVIELQDAVLFSGETIKGAIQESSQRRDDLGLGTYAIKEAILDSRSILRVIEVNIADGLDRVAAEVFHARSQLGISTSMLIDTIESANRESSDRIVVATSEVPIKRDPQNTPLAETTSSIPPEFEKKALLVMDAAAGFLKAWSNPVTVGAGLAIPIVAGVGIIVGGVVLVFNKLVDAVIDISSSVRSIAEGGLKGVVFGQSVPKLSSSTQKTNPVTIDTEPIVNAVQETNRAVLGQLAAILTAVNAIQANGVESSSRLRGLVAGADISDSIDRLNAAIQDSTRKLTNQLVSQPQSENLQGAGIRDIEFQSEVLTLLKSTLTVRIEADAREAATGEIPLNVFSEAVRPLVRGQESLNRMLDSNMRKLIEAVNELKSVPAVDNVQRTTTLKDTVNTEMSRASSDYILSETKQIRELLAQINNTFKSFNQSWERAKTAPAMSVQQGYSSLGSMDGN